MLERKTCFTANDNNSNRIICEFCADGFPELVRLAKVHVKNATGIMECHTHEGAFEITYHLKGNQYYYIFNNDGSNTKNFISGGDIFITYPNELHGTGPYNEEISDFYFFVIFIDKDHDFLNLNEKERNYFIEDFMKKSPRHIKASPYIKYYLDKIISVYKNPEISPLDNIIIKNMFFNIMNEIRENAFGHIDLEYNDVADIGEYVNLNIQDRFSINELAGKCNLSESRFKQKFKEYFGIPPIEYINKLKIESAKKLLINTDMSVTRIAMSLNFCSSSYFSEMFKKFAFLSPSDFRKLGNRQ